MRFPFDKKDTPYQENQETAGTYASEADMHRRRHINATTGAGIRRATLISMIGMILAKLTGFLRELLIVPKFGYGLFSDSYINAFLIPDFVYEILVGGVVAAVITPILSSGIESRKEKSAWHSVSVFISVSLLVAFGAMLLAEILAVPLMSLITGAYAQNASDQVVKMAQITVPITRILLFQSILMIGVSFLHGILSAYKRFTPVALGPSIYNICYILVLSLFGEASYAGVVKVAWGVVLSAFIYFLLQLFAARRELTYFHFSLDIRYPGFQHLFRLAIPTLISGSVLHLSAIIMNRFANGLNIPGAVTAVRQCTTTWSLPYAIFAVAIGNVMLPNIAGFYELNQAKKVRKLYTTCLRKALYFVAPFALAFALLNFETIQAIFQWNPEQYTNPQVASTASMLTWFCVSMLAHTVVFLTSQAFYARKVTKIALFMGFLSLLMNPVFLYLFVNVMDLGLEGIGMAHALYSCLTALFVFVLYYFHRHDMRPYRLFPFVLRLAICLLTSWFSFTAVRQLPLYPQNKIAQLVLYAIKLGFGLGTFYVTGIAIQMREAVSFQASLRSFFGLGKIKSEESYGL